MRKPRRVPSERTTPQEKEVERLFRHYQPAIRQAASEIEMTGKLIVVALGMTDLPVCLVSVTWANCEEYLANSAVRGMPVDWPFIKQFAEDHPERIPTALCKDFVDEDYIEWYFGFVDPTGELPEPGELVRVCPGPK